MKFHSSSKAIPFQLRVLFSIISKVFDLNIFYHTKKTHKKPQKKPRKHKQTNKPKQKTNPTLKTFSLIPKFSAYKSPAIQKPLFRMLRGLLWIIGGKKNKENKKKNNDLGLFKVLMQEEHVLVYKYIILYIIYSDIWIYAGFCRTQVECYK